MSVRGERVIYREREREVDYDEPQRRSYTTVKRYQVPDRDGDRRSTIFDNEEVKEEKITIRRDNGRSARSEVDFRSDRLSDRDRDGRREDIDIRITEREREPERRDVTYRVIERDSDRDTRGSRSDFRVVEREREVVRAPSPPMEERVREYRFERDRDFSPPRTRVAERDYDVERYSKTTDYYGQPQPIIIRESAPQPIIIREERRGPQQIIIRRDEPQFELIEREEVRNEQALTVREEPKAASTVKSVVKSSVSEVQQKPQEEDYYYERRIREVARDPRRRREDDIKPSDSASQYSSDDSYEYIRRERYIEDEPERHHKLHLAEGALAGAAAGAILSSHRKQQGKAGHTGRDAIGGAALGALGAEVISRARSRRGSSRRREYEDEDDHRSRRDRRRSYSRSRSRSQSKSRLNKYGGVAAVAAIGALAGYALKKSGNKETVVINEGSGHRSRSRRRRSSRYSEDQSLIEDNKALDPQHRNRRIAQAGLATAAAAGIYQRFRSKSRGRDRSKSRVRTGVPIVAAGLGGAALAGLYERNKASKAATRDAIIADEMSHRGRERSRSMSRSRSRGPRALDGRRDDPRIEYGTDPVYRDDRYYDEAPGHYQRRDRSVGSSPDTRRRSRSRGRDLATAGAAAGAGAAIAHEAARSRSRSRRRHDYDDDDYHHDYPHGDYITPPQQDAQYPASNYFAPPPTGDNAYAPYNPADYPPAAAGAPREAYGDTRFNQAQATAEARERQEDREMKQARTNDAGNVSPASVADVTTSEAMAEPVGSSLDTSPGTSQGNASSVTPNDAFANRASPPDRVVGKPAEVRSGSTTPRGRSTSRVRFDLDSNVAHSPILRHARDSGDTMISEDSPDLIVDDDNRTAPRRTRHSSSTLMNDPYERRPRRSRSNSDETVDLPARFDDRGDRKADHDALASTISDIFSGRSHGSSSRSERHDSGPGGGAIEEMLKGLVNEFFHGDDDDGRRGRQRIGRRSRHDN